MAKTEIQTLQLKDVLKSYRLGIDPKRFPGDGGGVILKHDALLSDWLYADLREGVPYQIRCGEAMDERKLKPGDIVATIRFSQFHAAIAPKSCKTKNAFAYCNLVVLVPDEQVVDKQYLTLWLRSERAINQIKSKAKVTPNIKKTGDFFYVGVHDLASIFIYLPDLDVQAEIASEYLAMLNRHEKLQEAIRKERSDFHYKLF